MRARAGAAGSGGGRRQLRREGIGSVPRGGVVVGATEGKESVRAGDADAEASGAGGAAGADGLRQRSEEVYAAEELAAEDDGVLASKVFELALPALFALAIDPLLTVADSAYVGRAGTDELGALAVASAVFALCFKVFNVTLSVVVAPIVTTDIAAGDVARARATVSDAMALALGVGVLATAGIELFTDDVLQLAGATQGSELAEGAAEYLRVRALALPAALTGAVGVGAFRGALDTQTPLRVAVAANALNFVLDPLLIFGLPQLGVQPFGLAGAGAATAAAEYLAAGWFITLLARRELLDVGRTLRFGGALEFARGGGGQGNAEGDGGGGEGSATGLSEVLAGGGGQLLRTLSLQTLLFEATASAASLDAESSAAAHQVVLQVWYTSLFCLDALAVAAQGLVANELGRGNVAGARRVSDLILRYSLTFGAGLGGLLYVGGTALPGIFTNDADVADAVAQPLRLVAALQPLNAAVFVVSSGRA